MDKYEKVLEIIEHPERYTAEQISSALSDSEMRAIYNTLCKTHSAISANKEIDVDAEWDAFAGNRPQSNHNMFHWFGSRAASIAVIVCSSLAAVAAGVAVAVAVSDNVATPSAPSSEAIVEVFEKSLPAQAGASEDSVAIATAPVMFEDDSLETIMAAIAKAYSVEVVFKNKETAKLHLYYKFDPSLPLKEIVSQLNNFEQINITLKNNTLTIN